MILDFRNLGYYSDLQTELANYFKSNIIDFLKDVENAEYIKKAYPNILITSINNFIFDFSNNTSTLNNGISRINYFVKSI